MTRKLMTVSEIAALRREHIQQAGQLRLLAGERWCWMLWSRAHYKRLAAIEQGIADELGAVLTKHAGKANTNMRLEERSAAE